MSPEGGLPVQSWNPWLLQDPLSHSCPGPGSALVGLQAEATVGVGQRSSWMVNHIVAHCKHDQMPGIQAESISSPPHLRGLEYRHPQAWDLRDPVGAGATCCPGKVCS